MPPAFETDTGIPVPAVTTEQMREIDRIAIEETGPNLYQMMENAGRSLATLALDTLGPHWGEAQVMVLAGAGGNGGGAICAARHLANRGARVTLCLASPDRLGEVPVWQLKVYRSTPGRSVDASGVAGERPDLVLDGLIGYSLTGSPGGAYSGLIDWANDSGAPVLSLDVPSGIDATDGRAPGAHIRPHTTMTLALPKTGLLSSVTGALMLADIGIPDQTYRRMALAHVPPFGDRYLVPLRTR